MIPLLTFVDKCGDKEAVGDNADGVANKKEEDKRGIAVDKHCLLAANRDGHEEGVDATGQHQVNKKLQKPSCPVSSRCQPHQLHRLLRHISQ